MNGWMHLSNRTINSPLRLTGIYLLCLLVAGCGGGGGGGVSGVGAQCDFAIATTPQALTATEVERLIAQAAEAADKLGAKATISVVDRVGNVLGTYRMTGAGTTVAIRSGRNHTGQPQGLDGLTGVVGTDLAAVAKAITGAYLSSSGNAFSTRTASFIVQEHFPATITQTPGGPLFGVQFSQLPCGDLVTRGEGVGVGPRRSPLGLSADPGGFPIYKNGRVVGGIGVVADGIYGLDLDPTDFDTDLDERIAQSALSGFDAPLCIRADRITANGITLAYSDSDNQLVQVAATSLNDAKVKALGNLLVVRGYYGEALVRAGTAFGEVASGVVPDMGDFVGRGGYILIDSAGANRYPPTMSLLPPAIGASSAGLSSIEVKEILNQALGVANQSRAQIRRPVGAPVQVSVSVVDVRGNVLGLVRTPDAPLFGTDVSLQKARTTAFFSSTIAASSLEAQPDANYISGIGVNSGRFSISAYINNPTQGARTFFNDPTIFGNGIAFTPRAIGNISRPYFPDGIDGRPPGVFSKSISTWSPFNTGLQLDLVYSNLVQAIADPFAVGTSCTATGVNALPVIKNGIQIFPGAVPIYRGTTLIGAIGVSGDGVDQDDMVAFLGLARAANVLHSGMGNAPAAIRSDTLLPQGVRLRYAQCPQSPFNDSSEQNVCSDL